MQIEFVDGYCCCCNKFGKLIELTNDVIIFQLCASCQLDLIKTTLVIKTQEMLAESKEIKVPYKKTAVVMGPRWLLGDHVYEGVHEN